MVSIHRRALLLVALLALSAGGCRSRQAQAQQALEQQRTEQEVEQALKQTRAVRQKLQDQLARPGGVFELLNNPADWRGQLQSARFSFQQARSLAQHAKLLDGPLGKALRELEERLESDERDHQLALGLEKVRLDKATVVGGTFDNAGAVRAYDQVFGKAGLPVVKGDEAALAAKLRQSPVREQLVASLDDWALSAWGTGEKDLAGRLLTLARLVDPDPVRDQLRDVQRWQDRAALARLAAGLKPGAGVGGRLSPQLYHLVGVLLSGPGAEAEGWLREGQAAYPADFWLNFQLGNLLQRKHQPAEASGFYRVVVAVRPHSSVAHNNLGRALHDKGDLAGAIPHFRRAINLDPKYAPSHNNLGLVLYAQKDLQGAIQEYRRAIELDPRLTEAYNNLGLALHATGDVQGALRAFRQAIALDPKYAQAYNNLGLVLFDLKDLEGAIQTFRRAIALDPGYAQAHNNLGLALSTKGDLPGAIQAYRRTIELDPKFAVAHNNLGIALYATKRLDEAVQAFQRAIDLNPRDARAHTNLGRALFDRQDRTGALQAFRRALELDPTNARAHYNVGLVLQATKDMTGALQAFRRTIQLDPKDARAHGALGRILLAQGEFGAARQATERALQLFPPGHPLRGLAQKQLQQCQQALQLEQQVAALLDGQAEPTGTAEQLQLIQFCRRYQRYRAAARLYDKALAAQPELANDLAKGHRYQAAAVAALAAAGQGKDAGNLTLEFKAKLHTEALDWLRADLKALSKALAANRPADVLLVCDRLERWQTSPDLSSLRDAKELAKLSQGKQNDCHRLWSEVAKLLQQARTHFTQAQHPGTLTEQQKEVVHEVPLQAGTTYVFDLESNAFDAFLRLEDANQNKVAENDDVEPGVQLNARIVFRPAQDGTFRLVATSFQHRGQGTYLLRIRAFAGPKK